jgi:hypothetical protein
MNVVLLGLLYFVVLIPYCKLCHCDGHADSVMEVVLLSSVWDSEVLYIKI